MKSSNIPSPQEFLGDVLFKPASGAVTGTAPLVTVVTVCFNPIKEGRQRLLVMNLDSVQQQSGIAVEHLIIDGASTDGTIDFLKAYANKSHDIRILSIADSGIYEAMNRGIALARGEYVIFLNSDDYYHRPDGLALSVKALEENDCSFTFAPINPVGPHTRHSPHRNPQRRLHKVFVFCTIPHPSMLFRKAALLDIGGYDQSFRLAADYDMMLRLIAAGHKACFVDCCFATFTAEGFSIQNKELNIREKVRVVRNFHQDAFGVNLAEQESEYLVSKCKYPRKYLSVYVNSQRLISQAFVSLPQGITDRISRSFNYVKYYFKCLLSS